jgi:hypothetical protein
VAVMDIAAVFAATHRFLASLSKNTGQFWIFTRATGI